MFILNVDYKDKDAVKIKGARWDSNIKKWYIPKYNIYHNFIEEIKKTYELSGPKIITNKIYLLVGKQKCWKCKKETLVIAMAYNDSYYFNKEKNIYEFENEWVIFSNAARMILTDDFFNYLQEKYNFKIGYSKAAGGNYYANHCQHCNSLQGDHFLFMETESPFHFRNSDDIKAINVICYPIKYDTIPYFEINKGIGKVDFFKYAKIENDENFTGEVINYL